ncbi:PAS domain-containing protein [Paludibacterium sp. dN 18-1]|uniref:histidine kinase n=1 Tax=Paludibacterium denitrificans TaxID=2675226 RepID=A0A844GED2_9NEIS|nr:PAS domain-containing protein [Paludibacterium denitrificans]
MVCACHRPDRNRPVQSQDETTGRQRCGQAICTCQRSNYPEDQGQAGCPGTNPARRHAFFVASDHLDHTDWKRYWSTLKLEQNLPGVQGFGLALLVRSSQLNQHIATIRQEGIPDYTVRPAGKRDLYTPIVYLEPSNDRNLRALGYDVFSEPVRRAALVTARDTGQATLTGKLALVQENGKDVQAGVIMYVPIYRRGLPTDTVSQRQHALIGWTNSPYRMSDLIVGILHDWQRQLGKDFNLFVYDGLHPTPSTLLFSGRARMSTTNHPLLYQQRIIDFNGHRWLLVLQRDQGTDHLDYTIARHAFIWGAVLSGLLAWLLWSLLNTRHRANLIAQRLTQDIRQREQLLKESEARWNFALEGSGLGVWDWDIETGTVFYSRRWKEMLGYTEQEIGNGLAEWEQRVHPDDLPQVRKQVQACLDNQIPHYVSEHRLRSKQGSYKWLVDRGMVILRDEAGKPLRMIGSHQDITEQKYSLLRIQQLAKLYAALSECNAAILRCTSEQQLFNRICEVVVQFGGMKLALDWPDRRGKREHHPG